MYWLKKGLDAHIFSHFGKLLHPEQYVNYESPQHSATYSNLRRCQLAATVARDTEQYRATK